MAQRNGRKRALIGFTALALLVLTALAPAASAQVPSLPDAPVDLPGGGGSGGGGSASGGSSGGGGGVTDTVGSVVDTTTDTVSNVGSGTTDTVGNVGSGATGAIGGAGEDIVDETKKTVENTTKDPGDAVNNAVGSVGGAVDGLGGSLNNPPLNVNSPLDRDRDRNAKGRQSTSGPAGGKTTRREAAAKSQFALERRQRDFSDAKFASLANAEKKSRENIPAPTLAAPPPRETFITQLADAAQEAAEKLAFPLGLALMVGAFLMVQGRIDRKDAKLALAPIDSEQDLLSFQ